MPLETTNLITRFSIPSSLAGFSDAQPNKDNSLGGFMSTTSFPGLVAHEIFDIISAAENTAETTDYRCFFVHNTHSERTAYGTILWMESEVAGGADAAIGEDPTEASLQSATIAQAVTIALETDAPAGVSFSAPTTEGTAINLGDLPPLFCRAVWVRRHANNTAQLAADGFTVRIKANRQP